MDLLFGSAQGSGLILGSGLEVYGGAKFLVSLRLRIFWFRVHRARQFRVGLGLGAYIRFGPRG